MTDLPGFKKFRHLLITLVLIASLPVGIVLAGSVTGTLIEWSLITQNTATTDVTDAIIALDLSAQTLASSGYVAADALNAHFHEGSTDIPNMPSTLKIDVAKGYNRSTADDTTDATDTGTDDMELPYLLNEEYHFALHNPARILHLVLSTATDHDVVTTWYYCDVSNATTCTSWVAFSGVSDSTIVSGSTFGFQQAGSQNISWTVPGAGAWGKENHESFGAYWVKVRVTSVSAAGTIAPLGEQSFYETGQWWFHLASISAGETRPYSLYTGGVDTDTFHQYFPGFAGVLTSDAAALEPGKTYGLEAKLNLKIDSNETGKIAHKLGAFDLEYTSAASIGGNNTVTIGVTGSGVSTFFGEYTHNEEDGGSYYSGTAEESYSKSFYKGSSNYKSARQVDNADILSNTSSEVVSHKIGQAYDTTTNTTPLFGAKIDDPS